MGKKDHIEQLWLVQIDQMVALPALGGLRNLYLEEAQLMTQELPVALARSLTSLTELRLCSGKIPSEISYMTALQVLQITGKNGIKLEMNDVDTLAALSSLHTLKLLSDAEVVVNTTSVNVLISLSRRYPSLKLIVQ